MGLTKQYLRYVPAGNLNIIASGKCNVVFVALEGQEGRYVATGASEHVFVWDLRLGEKARVLSGEKDEVTQLAASPDKRHLAVGYSDGTIKTFDLSTGEVSSIFIGHKSGITALAYDFHGHRLASGAKDTDIIVWDVVAETGICRLSGHKGIITSLAFMQDRDILLSSSKDTFVKFWDLTTEHNFRTLVGHGSEVWGLCLLKQDKYLVTGCNQEVLKVWRISFTDDPDKDDKAGGVTNLMEQETDEEIKFPLRCEEYGSILRTGRKRVVSLVADSQTATFACHGVDSCVELFRFLPEDKVKEKRSKRLKKERKKAAKIGETVEENSSTVLRDEVQRLPVIKINSKIKTIDIVMGKNGELRVCIGRSDNSLDLYSLLTEEPESEAKSLRSISIPGHRSDVRAVAFSSDNLAFATVSGDSIKLWNRPSLACLRTVTCGYALAVTFVPGDRHLIVGLKNGTMLIVDIAAGDILEEVAAHSKELWSVTLYPDMKGVASGGGDKTVKFWNFELIQDPESVSKAKVLSVIHSRTLELDDGVLCVRISPNNRFVAVSLLDSTVKIFFLDSFKFFISLYGHKLPVLCMDISSDSTLIATGSADRNVKIWGMDFGDCHKSIFAHDDSVTGLCFVPKTHYLFTSGKDGKVKEWDADIFQKIITLQGHAGEAWNCAVSPNGLYVLSCGSDHVLRLYERTSEPLVLEDEAEEEREAEETVVTGESTAVQGQKQQSLPSRKTVTSEKAAELLLECLEVCKEYNEQLSTSKEQSLQVPLLMQAMNCSTTEEFLLETVKRVRMSELEETLLLLPYSAACEILKMLPKLLKNDYQAELIARLTLCLVEAHHGPITANQQLLPILEKVEALAMKRILNLKDTVGYNLHAMGFIQRIVEEREGVQLFKEATSNRKQKNRSRKNKEKALKRAIMTL